MSIIKYNGNRLIPAPFVSVTKRYDKSNDGRLVGSVFDVTLQGTIVAFKGSPTSTGGWHTGTGYPSDETVGSTSRLASIQRKQEAIRDLFADEGKVLWIQSLDESTPVSGYPRFQSINFPEGTWYDKAPYTISLELDQLGPENEDTFTDYITSADESWGVETNEGTPEGIGDLSKTYRITHSVSAVGKRRQSNSGDVREAWIEARNWVQTKIGLDDSIAQASGVLNLPSYYYDTWYNHSRGENIDKRGGMYSVTEVWVLSSGNTTEDLNISTTISLDEVDKAVKVEGIITGFEEGFAGSGLTISKYDNALARFHVASGLAFTRAQSYSGLSLNLKPLSMVVGRNPVVGTVNYAFDYNDRPSNLISGARSESINISDNVVGGESFAEIFVLDRAVGPILQDLNTRASFKRNLSIEIVVERPTVVSTVDSIKAAFYDSNPRVNVSTSGDIENIITAINPKTIGINSCFSGAPQENWNFLKGKYSYNRTWTYVPSG